MKKILFLLSALVITSSGVSNVVSCETKIVGRHPERNVSSIKRDFYLGYVFGDYMEEVLKILKENHPDFNFISDDDFKMNKIKYSSSFDHIFTVKLTFRENQMAVARVQLFNSDDKKNWNEHPNGSKDIRLELTLKTPQNDKELIDLFFGFIKKQQGKQAIDEMFVKFVKEKYNFDIKNIIVELKVIDKTGKKIDKKSTDFDKNNIEIIEITSTKSNNKFYLEINSSKESSVVYNINRLEFEKTFKKGIYKISFKNLEKCCALKKLEYLMEKDETIDGTFDFFSYYFSFPEPNKFLVFKDKDGKEITNSKEFDQAISNEDGDAKIFAHFNITEPIWTDTYKIVGETTFTFTFI